MNVRINALLLPLLVAGSFACATTPVATTSTTTTSTATVENRLDTTPRHDEWVDVKHGARTVRTYVVYPQVKDRAMAVVVIHENRGLTDWVRTVADRLAEAGYVAIAPDLLSGMAPNGGGTKDFASEDAAREGISRVSADQATTDLRAVIAYARTIPAASGAVAVAGFCWGGARVWDIANAVPDLTGAYVFYGTGPQEQAAVAQIDGPVYGFYGGNDARVNATIPRTQEAMSAAGKTFQPVIYDGAGHAYMRLGEAADASPENRAARTQSWDRWLKLLQASAR